MEYFRVVNWEEKQAYKDRTPPWIKLYNSLLGNFEYQQLTDAERSHLIGIWLLASRTENKIPVDQKWIKANLFATSNINLKRLQDLGFIEMLQPDTDCPTNDSLEREKRERREEERRARVRWMARFDSLWEYYPRKEGKEAAKKAWGKIDGVEFDTILTALKNQNAAKYDNSEKKYIPLPSTWLNGKRWEDEISTKAGNSAPNTPTINV